MAAVHQQRLLLLCTSALHKTRKSMRSVPFGAWSKAKMSKLVFGHTFSPSKKRSDQFYKTATCMRGEEREQTQCLPFKTRFSQACSDSNAHRRNDRIYIFHSLLQQQQKKRMQNHSWIRHFSVSMRTFSATQMKLDFVAGDNEGNGGIIFYAATENFVKRSPFRSFSIIILRSLGHSFIFGIRLQKAKRTYNSRCDERCLNSTMPHHATTQWSNYYCIYYYYIQIPNKWMCETFITNYEMKIFTNLWFNMH